MSAMNAFQKHRFHVAQLMEWERMYALFRNAGGAYLLYCMNETGDHRIAIRRDHYLDTGGTLYIGAGRSLRERTSQMRTDIIYALAQNDWPNCLNNWPNTKHPVSRYYLNPEVRQQFPYEWLWVTTVWYTKSDIDPGFAAWVENIGLHAYQGKFGQRQRPPWNTRPPGSLFFPGLPSLAQQQLLEELNVIFMDEWNTPL